MATNGNGDDGPPPNGGGDLPVPDLRTMEELCQTTLNGQGGPIAPIAIQATNFGLKNDMIQQVQNSYQFHVQKIAKMFLGKYFPSSMVMKLKNEITNFRQRPDESLFEAWEHYKLSIDCCPNHNMLPVTQIDIFYNVLTLRHRDTNNAAAGRTFMKRRPEECYDLIQNMTAHHNDWDTFAQSTKDVQLPVVQVETQVPNSEPVAALVVKPVEAPVSALKPNPKPSIPYPSRLNDQKLHEKANDQMENIFQIF
nr:hypothetical protein [Tanacetum cinerariifolium]